MPNSRPIWPIGTSEHSHSQIHQHFPHDDISTTPDNVRGDSRPGKPAQKKIELALFDLEADRNETTNVADQQPDVVARLIALANKARADLGDSATKQTGSGVRKSGLIE